MKRPHIASIGTVRDSYDCAQAESLSGLYKTECIRRDGPFRTVDDLELGPLNRVHWFNEQRLHGSRRPVTPREFEQAYHRRITPLERPLSRELASH